MNTLDTIKHPYDASSVLNWMLARWSNDPSAALMIITAGGDGDALDNRIRVRLSTARSALKEQGIPIENHFGFHSVVIEWTTVNGPTYNALCVNRITHMGHRIAARLGELDLKDMKDS